MATIKFKNTYVALIIFLSDHCSGRQKAQNPDQPYFYECCTNGSSDDL